MCLFISVVTEVRTERFFGWLCSNPFMPMRGVPHESGCRWHGFITDVKRSVILSDTGEYHLGRYGSLRLHIRRLTASDDYWRLQVRRLNENAQTGTVKEEWHSRTNQQSRFLNAELSSNMLMGWDDNNFECDLSSAERPANNISDNILQYEWYRNLITYKDEWFLAKYIVMESLSDLGREWFHDGTAKDCNSWFPCRNLPDFAISKVTAPDEKGSRMWRWRNLVKPLWEIDNRRLNLLYDALEERSK